MQKYLFLATLLFGSSSSANSTAEDYQFKLGYWQIVAKTMQPDRSYATGSGTGRVFINNVGIIQDDLCIAMEGTSDVIGSTFRTFSQSLKYWYITWIGLASPTNTGIGNRDTKKPMIQESFVGEDKHGAYTDVMNFTLINKDQYTANLSRTYENGGYHIDCIWCYEATRMRQPLKQKVCQHIQ